MPITIAGTPATSARAAGGLTQTAAATVSTVVTAAISVSGIAKRTVRASESTSAVVRETRSPVPARSTLESGSASTVRMKSSRSSAKIRSETTNEVRRANQVSTVWSTMNAASTRAMRSTYARVVPSVTAWTRRPSRAGPTSPAAAASAWRATTPPRAARCRLASRRA